MNNEGFWVAIVAAVVAICFALTLLFAFQANAHDWYDFECCSERDCAPVIYSLRLPNGDLKVSTKNGFGIVTKETKKKSSSDNEEHACMLPNSQRVICFYEPLNY